MANEYSKPYDPHTKRLLMDLREQTLKQEFEDNYAIIRWLETSLNEAPSMFHHYKDSYHVLVFLPRYIRIRIANYFAHISGQKEPYKDSPVDYSTATEFNGWKIVDGYQNALIISIIAFAHFGEEYTHTKPFPRFH